MQNAPKSLKKFCKKIYKLPDQVGWVEEGVDALMGTGISFYPPVPGDNKANMGVPPPYLPIFQVMANGPDPNIYSCGNGRTGRGSTVKAGEQFRNPFPPYNQAIAFHSIPLNFWNIIQKFHPFNQGIFQGIGMRKRDKC